MNFWITRVNEGEQPCEGAVFVDSAIGADDEYYFPPKRWRDDPAHYEIEVNSIEELLKLATLEKHGIVIDFVKTRKGERPRITIYDGYIE